MATPRTRSAPTASLFWRALMASHFISPLRRAPSLNETYGSRQHFFLSAITPVSPRLQSFVVGTTLCCSPLPAGPVVTIITTCALTVCSPYLPQLVSTHRRFSSLSEID